MRRGKFFFYLKTSMHMNTLLSHSLSFFFLSFHCLPAVFLFPYFNRPFSTSLYPFGLSFSPSTSYYFCPSPWASCSLTPAANHACVHLGLLFIFLLMYISTSLYIHVALNSMFFFYYFFFIIIYIFSLPHFIICTYNIYIFFYSAFCYRQLAEKCITGSSCGL